MKKILFSAVFALLAVPAFASADTVSSDFESFTLGSVNGQNGWVITGAFDQGVVSNLATSTSFLSQSLRISDSVTSGSFGDQLFSPSTINEAGETDALNGNMSGGVRQARFEAQFDIASTMLAQQAGMHLSVSPDRGDGARMSYLRFEDGVDGINIFFDDIQGILANGVDGCTASACANFTETQIATSSRVTPHTIKFVMDFVEGPSNDVVKIFIDGILVHTGTSWEDYYRFDPESNPTLVSNSRTVDSLLFRESGIATPANAGNGFLIDNVSLSSSNAGLLGAQDFGVMDFSGVKGYTAGFNLINANLADITSATVQLYSGITLLQTNTASTSLAAFGGSQFSSPFDVLGSFDYIADGVWVNQRESEFGKTLVPTKVVGTVTLANGKIVTAENTSLTGTPFTLSSIEITNPASKLTYFTGETLDSTGLVITGTYSDASTSTIAVTNANITGFDSSTPVSGQALTITVGGKTATYTINIISAPISSGGGGFTSSPSANASPVAQFVTSNTPNTGGQVLGAAVSALASQGKSKGKVLGASVSAFARDMRSGARGDDVTTLQNILISEGHLKIKTSTGYFGPLTKSALIKWQLKHKLPGTGYFGPMSRAVLDQQ